MTFLQNLDSSSLLLLQGLRVGWLDAAMSCYTQLGDEGLMWIALALLLLCRRSTRRAGAAALLAMAMGALCTNVVLKHLVARPRPWLNVAGLLPLIPETDPNSFPSGHTCAAFAAGVVWARTLPRRELRALALIGAAVMGFSRLYVGVHYPSDVLAGAVIGTGCAFAALSITKRVARRLDKKIKPHQ